MKYRIAYRFKLGNVPGGGVSYFPPMSELSAKELLEAALGVEVEILSIEAVGC